jgi:uncharacterized membrane protein YdbT with pleckstrin-like domain
MGALLCTVAVGAFGLWLLAQIHETSRPWLYALAAVVALPLAWTIGRAAQWSARSVTVTDRRILITDGLLRRSHESIRLERITDVHVSASVLERLVRRGDVILEMFEDDPVELVEMRRPQALRRVIARVLDQRHEQVGSVPGGDVAERLDALDALYEAGRIEDFEYDERRARILEDL